jgi:hypothetical protein
MQTAFLRYSSNSSISNGSKVSTEAGAIQMSPIVIIPAAVTAVGIGAYEGGCYLSK